MSPRFHASWYGPFADRAAAVDKAHRIANKTQRAVAVFRVETTSEEPCHVLNYATDGPPSNWPGAPRSYVANPDPKARPKYSWPVLHIFASTDRVQRDVQVDSWRKQSERAALAAIGVTNKERPYAVSVGETHKSFGGYRVPLYTLIVRQNPNFPHDKLAQPLTPTRRQ